MKTLTQEWLNAAHDDLLTIEHIINDDNLTHIVAFHAEQAVEKCLKALLEEYAVEFPKTHDLSRLYKLLTASSCRFAIDRQDMFLQRLGDGRVESTCEVASTWSTQDQMEATLDVDSINPSAKPCESSSQDVDVMWQKLCNAN